MGVFWEGGWITRCRNAYNAHTSAIYIWSSNVFVCNVFFIAVLCCIATEIVKGDVDVGFCCCLYPTTSNCTRRRVLNSAANQKSQWSAWSSYPSNSSLHVYMYSCRNLHVHVVVQSNMKQISVPLLMHCEKDMVTGLKPIMKKYGKWDQINW